MALSKNASLWLLALVGLGYYNRDVIVSFSISSADALKNANVKAFLLAIRSGESSTNSDAYTMLVYGGNFFDFSKHPNVRKPIPGTALFTTAAGAYQITYSTWLWLHVLAGVSDFSPDSQDIMAVVYLKKLGALADIVAGRYDAAMTKCAPVWEAIRVPSLKKRLDATYAQQGGLITTA